MRAPRILWHVVDKWVGICERFLPTTSGAYGLDDLQAAHAEIRHSYGSLTSLFIRLPQSVVHEEWDAPLTTVRPVGKPLRR